MIKILTYKRINCDNRDCQMCEGNPYLVYEIRGQILSKKARKGIFPVL